MLTTHANYDRPLPRMQAQRLASMELLAHLSAAHGHCLGSSSLESIGLASK